MKTTREVSLTHSIVFIAFLLTGCSTQGYSVIASTATTIGVSISQQPTNGVLDATLGYKRAEFAFVPTNRSGGEISKDSHKGGAKDSTDVIMELRYSGIFSLGENSGIYQRLAVGTNAVQQEGAIAMFAKGPDGKIDKETLKALQAVKGIPQVDESIEREKAKLSKKYNEFIEKGDADALKKFDDAVKNACYSDFKAFSSSREVTADKIQLIRAKLKEFGIQLEN